MIRYLAMVRTWVLALLVTSACGPIAYVNEVTRRAASSVEVARAAHADKYAPYWWTRATQYLHQARVKAAYADFQGANRFGRLAAQAAEKATEEAGVAAADPSKRPLEQHDPGVPAKDEGSAAPTKDVP